MAEGRPGEVSLVPSPTVGGPVDGYPLPRSGCDSSVGIGTVGRMRRLVPILLGALTIVDLVLRRVRTGRCRQVTQDQIVLAGKLVVPEGEVVETALIFDGPPRSPARSRRRSWFSTGTPRSPAPFGEDVVVFNGDLVIGSGAEVGGDLVTNSTPTVEEGATVRGDRVNVVTRFDVDVVERADSRGGSATGVLADPRLAPARVRAAAGGEGHAAVKDRLGASIGWGAGLFFLLPIGSVILLVTVVGIPLGLFTMLALALIYSVGYVVAATAVGELLVKNPSSRFLVFLVGGSPCARSR